MGVLDQGGDHQRENAFMGGKMWNILL